MTSPTQSAIQKSFSSVNTPYIDVKKAKENMDDTLKVQQSGAKYQGASSMIAAGLFDKFADMCHETHALKFQKDQNIETARIINEQTAVVKQLEEVVREIKETALQIDPSTTAVDPKLFAENSLRKVASLLNSSANGVYLFGGETNVPPIPDVEKFIEETNIVNGKSTGNFTNVVKSNAKTTISEGLSIDLALDVKSPVICDLIAGLHEVKNVTPDASSKANAFVFLDRAEEGLRGLTVKIGSNDQALTSASKKIESRMATIAEATRELYESDIAETVTAVKQAEAAHTTSAAAAIRLLSIPPLAERLG